MSTSSPISTMTKTLWLAAISLFCVSCDAFQPKKSICGFIGIIETGRKKKSIIFGQTATCTDIDASYECVWSPQDLTQDSSGHPAISSNDYIKQYQQNPELWPVEFFLIPYRRVCSQQENGNKSTETKTKTEILVRKSANGTSKYGLGTGVPVTRWMPTSSSSKPPKGYQWSEPKITFPANHFPEYNSDGSYSKDQEPWTYGKIDIQKDAFQGDLQDDLLEKYARDVHKHLKITLSKKAKNEQTSWESSRISIVKNIVDNYPNAVAAIQGTLRMGGMFERKKPESESDSRYIDLGDENAPAPDPAKLAQSIRILTMYPQMPSPMPLPSTSPEELKKEIETRQARMAKSGRDQHQDEYGRKYTHISTNNVSNTIIGVYLTLDATDMPGLDDVSALDLFGKNRVEKQWKSLEDLKVLDVDGESLSTEDTKPTFISGFIVRQLVKEGIIDIYGK